MATPSKYIAELIYRHLNGSITASQAEELQAWSGESPDNERFLTELTNEPDLIELILFHEAYERNDIKSSLYNTIHSQIAFSSDSPAITSSPIVRRIAPARWWAAASVILLLGIGAYLWTTHKKNIQSAIVAAKTVDIAPGKEGAILTLADGSQVVLDSLGNGLVAAQKGAQVLLRNGQLAYAPTGETAGEMLYNTMTTPKGRKFQVVLPDGTKVWLNAASSIRYPTVFDGNERRIEITGEAYFEVAKNTKMPFRASVNNSVEVEVLGTHFNINAYNDESVVRTTLLEGSVRIKTGLHQKVLQPNEQAVISNTDVKIINVNIDEAVAWKNGLFNFNGADIKTVMRQLERWYDIKVKYEGAITKETFRGKLQQNLTLSQVVETLKDLDVKFRIEGRTLILE